MRHLQLSETLAMNALLVQPKPLKCVKKVVNKKKYWRLRKQCVALAQMLQDVSQMKGLGHFIGKPKKPYKV